MKLGNERIRNLPVQEKRWILFKMLSYLLITLNCWRLLTDYVNQCETLQVISKVDSCVKDTYELLNLFFDTDVSLHS